MDEDTRASENPRSPAHQEYTGTGTPRSADDGLPEPGAYSGTPDTGEAVVTGMESTSQPALGDEVDINRSGSGGSGGPAVGGEELEGSTPASMSELLTGEERTLGEEDEGEPR